MIKNWISKFRYIYTRQLCSKTVQEEWKNPQLLRLEVTSELRYENYFSMQMRNRNGKWGQKIT